MRFDEINEQNIEEVIKQAAAGDITSKHALIKYHFEVKNAISEGGNLIFTYLFENPIERFENVSDYLKKSLENSQQVELFNYFSENPDSFSKTAQGFLYWIGCGVAQDPNKAKELYIEACPDEQEEGAELSLIPSFPTALVMRGLVFESQAQNNDAIECYKLAEKNRIILPENYIEKLLSKELARSPFELVMNNVNNKKSVNNQPANNVQEVISSDVGNQQLINNAPANVFKVPSFPIIRPNQNPLPESPRKQARRSQGELNRNLDNLCNIIEEKNKKLEAQSTEINFLNNECAELKQENTNLQSALTQKNATIDALQAEVNRLNGIVERNKEREEQDTKFFAELASRIGPLLLSNPLKRKEPPKGSSSDEDNNENNNFEPPTKVRKQDNTRDKRI